jgi:ankyrin repeat protein
MHLAAALNRTAILQYLIFRGGNLNLQNKLGKTPLMIGVENWNFDSVKILTQNGADLNIKVNS